MRVSEEARPRPEGGVGGIGLTGGSGRAHPAATLLAIRLAYWLGTALTLVWAPHLVAGGNPDFRAWDGVTDLLAGTFGQWDATWFLHVADHGYDSRQAAAFFPLYPLVVHVVALAVGSTAVAGILVSIASGAAAAVALDRLARPLLGPRGARETVLLAALWPLAFVLTAVYSDGLFLALAAWAFVAAGRGSPVAAALLGAAAVGTRAVGLALLPALAALLWPARPSPRSLARLAPLALVPVPVGLFAWHLHRQVGDGLAFVHAQSAFWQRHTPTLGPAGGLWEAVKTAWHGTGELLLHLPRTGAAPVRADQVSMWSVTHLALLGAALWLTWVAWRRLGAAYGLYSAAYLAIVLSTTSDWFPLQSFPRFVLGDFPLFLALASVLEGRPRARTVVLAAFAAVGAAAAVGFSRHAWIA